MARSVKLKSIRARNNSIIVRYGKSEVEIPGGKRELRQWVKEQVSDADEFLLAIALACQLERDPQLNDVSSIEGKTITLDLSGNLASVDGIVRLS